MNRSSDEQVDVGVVGAGLAGLECARRLRRAGLSVVVWEAATAVGGRIRTDTVDGHLLDRGFQLLNPAYPAVLRSIDVDALDLGGFAAGVAARVDDGLLRIGHPLREPALLLATARALVVSPGDVVALARWVRPLLLVIGRRHKAALLRRQVDVSLAASLDLAGLDKTLRRVVDRFFAGVLLDDRGESSTQLALLLSWMFATGVPGLPARGMQALPEQLADDLPGCVRLEAAVDSVERRPLGFVVHDAGGSTAVQRVVIATGAPAAAALTGRPARAMRGVVTQYFSTEESPAHARLLHVDARVRPGPLVNAAVVSAAQPTYAPAGRHLVQASALLGRDRPAPSEREMRDQTGVLLGCSTSRWEAVGRAEVWEALPARSAPLTPGRPEVTADGLVVCGDHLATPSIQGALVSGRDSARLVLRLRSGAARPT